MQLGQDLGILKQSNNQVISQITRFDTYQKVFHILLVQFKILQILFQQQRFYSEEQFYYPKVDSFLTGILQSITNIFCSLHQPKPSKPINFRERVSQILIIEWTQLLHQGRVSKKYLDFCLQKYHKSTKEGKVYCTRFLLINCQHPLAKNVLL